MKKASPLLDDGELHAVRIQEARSRQKTDRLSEVRTFGVVVSPKDVL